MFGIDISKLSQNSGASYITNPNLQPNLTFVKQSYEFTPSLDKPVTKSDYSEDLLCGAPVLAEHLDFWA